MGGAQLGQPVATPAAQTLEAELNRTAALGLDEMRALWREMTQRNAPKALSRDLLARMIAYRVQEQRLGKLGRETRKLLDRLAKGGAEPVRHLKVGTVMVREHQGTLHEVMVGVPVVNFIRLAYCRESRDELPHAGRAQAYLVGAQWAVAISSVA